MWVMGGVFERFPRLKVVFVEPGPRVGRRGGCTSSTTWTQRQGYDFPAITELPSYYFHRNVSLTFIDEPDAVRHAPPRARRREHHVVERLPAPGVELAATRARSSTKMFAGVPDDERELIVSGNAARVWNL